MPDPIPVLLQRRVVPKPWGGTTLEWQTTSPPPLLNFDREIIVTRGPYDHEEEA